MRHKVYEAIVRAIKVGQLTEPFTMQDFESSCPGFGNGTYNAFLYKHTKGNKGGNSELFKGVAPGKFRCLRPFKYGL
jgi:hypothetical protein